MRIAAAILAFNRLESLKRCLDTVRAQSRPPDEIIVIDNASNDGTGEWLDEQPGLVVIHESENRGCAGGFNIAMRTAYERGHDWVFVMDDDIYAAPQALERLLEAAQTMQAQGVRIGGLHTRHLDKKVTQLSMIFPRTAGQAWTHHYNSRETSLELERGTPVEISWYSFCGVLISREALASAGFPDPDYVYWCDDTDLACRQRALGFRHYLVPQAVVEHKGSGFTQQYGRPPTLGWRHYYMHRNRWRLIWRHGHLLGQPMKLVCQVSMLTQALRQAVGTARRGNFSDSRLVLQGVVDGFLGRMGERVAPGG